MVEVYIWLQFVLFVGTVVEDDCQIENHSVNMDEVAQALRIIIRSIIRLYIEWILANHGLLCLSQLFLALSFQIFSAFGTIQKIAMFEKNAGLQALIQYPSKLVLFVL